MKPIAARPRAYSLWQRLWEMLSLYLPIVLMGSLALVTYSILQRIPAPPPPVETPLAAGLPDYRLERFTLRRYDRNGQPVVVLSGEFMEHHPSSASLWIHAATLEHIERADGVRTHARARELRTDDDRTFYQFSGDVRLIREPLALKKKHKDASRLVIEGQQLTWHSAQRLLTSDQPVRLMRGTHTLSANRLRYDERSGIVDLQGQVRATLAAR